MNHWLKLFEQAGIKACLTFAQKRAQIRKQAFTEDRLNNPLFMQEMTHGRSIESMYGNLNDLHFVG